jgi:hypothetical protein
MSGVRPWQLTVWRQVRGAPYVSLGVHVDFHTPTLDFHLPFCTVQLGRNGYWRRADGLPGMWFLFEDRVLIHTPTERWGGHSDNCDHEREAPR